MSGWKSRMKGYVWCCAALVLCGGLLFSGGCGGCSKKPKVYTSRANDPAYGEMLVEERLKQLKAEQAWHDTAMQMTQLVARVRAAYPQGIGEDALQEKLAADAEWQRLAALEQEKKEFAREVWEGSKRLIQARQIEEQQALAAVKAGKAKALDTPREMLMETSGKPQGQRVKPTEEFRGARAGGPPAREEKISNVRNVQK